MEEPPQFYIFDMTDDGPARLDGHKGHETYAQAVKNAEFKLKNGMGHRRLAIFERRETFSTAPPTVVSDDYNPS